MGIKKIVRTICPEFVLNAMRTILRKMSPAKLAYPVVQMYVNDGDIESTAGFNNFVSFLAAGTKATGQLQVTLRDSDGLMLVDKTCELNHFENRFLSIKAMLDNEGKQSQLGLISMVYRPASLRNEAYKRLGTLVSHFFMFYKGRTGSVAMVHPSSTLDPQSPSGGPFATNQVVETKGLEAVTLYQCNPSQNSHELTIGLQDAETKEVMCSQVLRLPPMGVRKVSFSTGTDFRPDGRAVRVFTSSLPTANSKPMLCRNYADQRFSISHS